MSERGWYQVAFERDLREPVTPAAVGKTPLILVRTRSGLRAFEAHCPHRGAHLGFGGCLEGDSVVCPFHGHRIHLGYANERRFTITEFACLHVGGLVFVRLCDDHENGLTALLRQLDAAAYYVPGFCMHVAAPAALVIENAFDPTHFGPVHDVANVPGFAVDNDEHGSLVARGHLDVPAAGWPGAGNRNTWAMEFTARAFSPGLVISTLVGPYPHTVITGATPNSDGGCDVRISVVVEPVDDKPPDASYCRTFLEAAREGIERDRRVWEHIRLGGPERLLAADRPVTMFRDFCRTF